MMNYDLRKVSHGAFAEFDLVDGRGNVVGSASYPLRLAWVDPITVETAGAASTMVPNFGKSALLPLGAPMKVESNGRLRGEVRGADAHEVARYTPNTFYRADIDGASYAAYVVGFWRKGRFLCIHRRDPAGGERQVAQVDLPTVVDGWLDRYRLHCIDEPAFAAALFLTLYVDYARESHRLEYPAKAKGVKLKLTWNKELRSKYDPRFEGGVA